MQLDPLSPPDSVEFNGITYRLMGGRRKYYLSQSRFYKERKSPKGLHVAIWEFYSGQSVPKGWHVHHKDGNTFNNDFENLKCLSPDEHKQIPKPLKDPEKQKKHLEAIRVLATKWHKSDEGRAWHKEHGKKSWEGKEPQKCICLYCSKEFYSRHPKQALYCCASCGYKHRKSQGRYRVERECVKCGKLFTTDLPINPGQVKKTCSRSCASSGKRKPRQ